MKQIFFLQSLIEHWTLSVRVRFLDSEQFGNLGLKMRLKKISEPKMSGKEKTKRSRRMRRVQNTAIRTAATG